MPTVLSVGEVARLFAALEAQMALLARLLYGTGLRNRLLRTKLARFNVAGVDVPDQTLCHGGDHSPLLPPPPGLRVIPVESWDQLVTYFRQMAVKKRGFIFRGQADAAWDPVPSLYRKLIGPHSQWSERGALPTLLGSFRRNIVGLRGTNPPALSDDQLWALARHHGMYTPLLDFTSSPYVAAYFAFSDRSVKDESQRAIWALNLSYLPDREANPSLIVDELDPILVSGSSDGNIRLKAQAGLLLKLHPERPLREWADQQGARYPNQNIMLKFELNNYDRCAVLSELRAMNITALTLFPDFDGAARQCNEAMDEFLIRKSE